MNTYPAICARMGSWHRYYIVRMTMREVANEVGFASEFHTDPTLDEAIQRTLNESRAKMEIARYLQHPDRFFSSIVVAALGGKPTFLPVRIEDIPEQRFLASPGEVDSFGFGVLKFQGGQKYYALDGQHRLKAIKELLATPDKRDTAAPPEGFEDEQISVLMVCATEDERDFTRTYRRLFSSLNRYAKPTDPDTNIIMDEDDAFAILTRRLINEHSHFKAKGADVFRVQTEGKNIRPTVKIKGESKSVPNPSFTSLQTLYDMNQILLTTRERGNTIWNSKKAVKVFQQNRPDDEDLDSYFKEICTYWDALLDTIPDLKKNPATMRIFEEGSKGVGHVLFMPIGQEVLAYLARDLLDQHPSKGQPMSKATAIELLKPLAKVDWLLHSPPWRHLFLIWDEDSGDSGAWKMRTGERQPAREIALRILRWVLGISKVTEPKKIYTEWRNRLVPAQREQEAKKMWAEVLKQKNKISG